MPAESVTVDPAASPALRGRLVEGAAAFRHVARLSLEWFGDIGFFCARVARAAVTPPYELRELVRQCDEIGARSMALVAVAGAAIGVVLTLETRNSLVRLGAESTLPAILVLSILRETGPVITGLIVSGRVGAGIGAALGSMKVTDQIDAMTVSAVNPFRFLAATRILACVLMLPLLTLVCDFSGVIMGWLATSLSRPMSLQLFINLGLANATLGDFLPPTFKTAVFGLIIGVVSSFEGMRATGGTEGVGRAATNAVVVSSLFIILADVIMVRLILIWFP